MTIRVTLKNVRSTSHRLESESRRGNYNKILEGRKKCKCIASEKIEETNRILK